MEMTAKDPTEARAQRAQFWGRVSSMLREKGASGHSQAVARELALDTRRAAADRWSPEWIWLRLSKPLGYGTRVLQPVLLWALVALLAATALIAWVDGWREVMSGSFGAVWWNLFVSPFQFLRPLPVDTALTEMASEGTWQQVIVFFARVFGTAAFVFAGVAVARLTRVRLSP